MAMVRAEEPIRAIAIRKDALPDTPGGRTVAQHAEEILRIDVQVSQMLGEYLPKMGIATEGMLDHAEDVNDRLVRLAVFLDEDMAGQKVLSTAVTRLSTAQTPAEIEKFGNGLLVAFATRTEQSAGLFNGLFGGFFNSSSGDSRQLAGVLKTNPMTARFVGVLESVLTTSKDFGTRVAETDKEINRQHRAFNKNGDVVSGAARRVGEATRTEDTSSRALEDGLVQLYRDSSALIGGALVDVDSISRAATRIQTTDKGIGTAVDGYVKASRTRGDELMKLGVAVPGRGTQAAMLDDILSTRIGYRALQGLGYGLALHIVSVYAALSTRLKRMGIGLFASEELGTLITSTQMFKQEADAMLNRVIAERADLLPGKGDEPKRLN